MNQHFIIEPYVPGQTIAAIATPPGEGGVAIIRISGKEAIRVAEKVYSKPVANLPSHTVHYGHIVDTEGRVIDDVLLLPFLGRRSFTGEDTIEIHCHGGNLLTKRVLTRVLQAGARAAKPGEFTFKAFMNGKIDLTQAEAIQELIAAKNEHALAYAADHLQGSLSLKIKGFQEVLLKVAAMLEAWVDFPEEGIEFAPLEMVIHDLETVTSEMKKLASTFHDGKIIQEGVALCLVGAPNVGKSSLMNALLERERAIVSATAGTTRDLLEEGLRINGMHFRLTDTAGIRESVEPIEQEGIKRTRQAMASADLILFVIDQHIGLDPHSKAIAEELPKEKTVLIRNKADLPAAHFPSHTFREEVILSAKTKVGLEELKSAIDRILWKKGAPSKEEIFITTLRHFEALEEAISCCLAVKKGLQEGASPEFLASDMRFALMALGKIVGHDITEDVLSKIFSTFCVGK